MNTETTTEAPQWAIIELMGHIRYGGRVTKDNQFGTPLLRVEVPLENGDFVTQLVNPSSIYRLTMASEELARAAARNNRHEPMSSWDIRHLIEQQPAADIFDGADDDSE
jgi:hypothetical protein